MGTNPLVRLGELGQSPWLDFITRDLIVSGELKRLIEEDGLRGMTSNPTIFQQAIAGTALYDADIEEFAEAGRSPEEIFEILAVGDVGAACDVFRALYEATDGGDGLVSIEVPPALARDTEGTIEAARRLWRAVGRPNVMIKIPGTGEGLPAIEECTAFGINVNVTLLFSVLRYEEVIEAYWAGLERRLSEGEEVERVASVASFFVSRLDTKVDARLDALGGAQPLRGRIAIANACTAYAAFERTHASLRWQRLARQGARPQRPLWASTSTKDPRYPDLHYVEALIAPNTVNTMPPHTLAAYRDHGRPGVRIGGAMRAATSRLGALRNLGIDLERVTAELEDEGIEKFAASTMEVLTRIEAKADALLASRR
ncbi:MAG: transaldolase [Gemmatimonadetes bacterium]|nr:transaldolase [Gemmatimonadota bacterium]